MPQTRYVFSDLDGLLASVSEHIRLQPAVFGSEHSLNAPALDAPKVTDLLSGQNAIVVCRQGVCQKIGANVKHAFSTAGWELKYRCKLEDLLKRKMSETGPCEGKLAKTLVLAVGNLRRSVLNVLDTYLTANWRVQVFCLRRSNMEIIERLRTAHPANFQNVYLDRLMKGIIRSSSGEPSNQEPTSFRMLKLASERYALMDLDTISDTPFRSISIWRKVSSASSSQELRIDFRRLTAKICGGNQEGTKSRVATYHNSHPHLVQGLMSLQWTTKKQHTRSSLEVHLDFLARLVSADLRKSPKTLVLVMGDGGLDSIGKVSFKGIIEVLIAHRWRIEVHAWSESLGDTFLGLEKKYPSSVSVNLLDEVLEEVIYLKSKALSRQGGTNGVIALASETQISAGSNHRTDSALAPYFGSELSSLHDHMRELKRAIAEFHTSNTLQTTNQLAEVEQRLKVQEEEFARRLDEQQNAFSSENEQRLQLARETRLSRLLILQEREQMLTCPITHCLYESPVIAACCGKTFTKAAVDRLQGRNRACPWCRQTRGFTTHPNRDVANLVEQYKAELQAFESADQ